MRNFLTLFIFALFAVASVCPATADTYHFIFSPEKKTKKKSETGKVTLDKESNSDGNDTNSTKTEEKSPTEQTAAPTPPTSGAAPLVIHNDNNIVAPAPQANEAVAPAPPTSSLSTPPTSESRTMVLIPSQSTKFSKLRFGFSGTYLPSVEVEKDFFSRSFGESWTSKTSTYGGMVSLAFVPAPIFATNIYFGIHNASSYGKTLVQIGVDGELYPFASLSRPYHVTVFELGLLAGAHTSLQTANLAGVHAGARLNINFGSRFGLTSVVRAGTDSAIIEGGFITRL